MVVHAVTNSYWMPDGVTDNNNDYNDELQNFTAPPWNNAAVLWHFTRLSNGSYRIASTNGSKHVTLADEAARRNSSIRLRGKRTGSTAQHWDLVTIPGLADAPGRAPVRAIVARGTSYAIGMVDNAVSLDAEMRLIRMWHGQPTVYHGWTLIPVPQDEQEAE